MENPKVGQKIIITHIGDVNGNRYYTSSMGKCPQDVVLPYETTVVKAEHKGTYSGFGDGKYGFWTEKTQWKSLDLNYEIF